MLIKSVHCWSVRDSQQANYFHGSHPGIYSPLSKGFIVFVFVFFQNDFQPDPPLFISNLWQKCVDSKLLWLRYMTSGVTWAIPQCRAGHYQRLLTYILWSSYLGIKMTSFCTLCISLNFHEVEDGIHFQWCHKSSAVPYPIIFISCHSW